MKLLTVVHLPHDGLHPRQELLAKDEGLAPGDVTGILDVPLAKRKFSGLMTAPVLSTAM